MIGRNGGDYANVDNGVFVVDRDCPPSVTVDTDPVTSEARTSGGGNAYTDGWFREHIMPAIRERGMKICMANHNFRRWVPPHRYFDEHPEWYALHGGKRNPWIGQMCLCTTNADMLAAMTANIKQYLRENPEVGIVGVCPEDGYGCCQCEACRALDDDPRAAFRTDRPNYRTPQGENRSLIRRYALLANAVARALRKEFPDVLVYYTAYIDLQWPPRDVRLEDNVAVMLALYWRCAAHLIAADGCAMNRFFYDLLRQWQRAHRGPLFIHDYYYGMDSQRALPYPMGAVICANWPVYRQIGVAGVKTNTKSTHLAALGLNYTAFARCGWEKQVDYDALRNEFVTGMFGAAAPALLPVYAAFDRAVEKIARGAATDSPFIKPVPPARGCLLPNGRNIGYFIDEIGAGFLTAAARRAEDMAVNDRERRQVARFRDAVEYWRLSREFCERIMKAEAAEKAGGGAARRWYGLAHASILDLIEHSERKGLDGWGVTPGVFAWQADELARKAT